MSIRARLALILSTVFFLMWGFTALCISKQLDGQLSSLLDHRLIASARLVAGLMDHVPTADGARSRTASPARNLALNDLIACEVSSLQGDVIASSNLPIDANFNLSHEGFADMTYAGERWRTYTTVHGQYRITTADRLQERDALIGATLKSAGLPIIIALIVCLVMLSLAIKNGLKPLRLMSHALKSRQIDSVEPLDIHKVPRELQPLLKAQNQLLLRVANAIERERRFTGDAAHELRTPLTAVKTHLQLAGLCSGEAQVRALQHAEQGADRLQHTLEQLLMLAKVEGSLSFDDGNDYTTQQIATFAIQDAENPSASRVKLTLSEPTRDLRPAMPSALAIVALRNLLDNALRYSPPGSPVELDVALHEGHLVFAVRDYGDGVQDADLVHLSERFWRNSRSKGCGLGLAIVDAIIRRCACRLVFSNVPNGFLARLEVPIRKAS
ncbi:ATP-binding protein [uncultured Pseudomonas sp.]|uniref:ATP-binding protein n=1 Tax=uncultured Pseudomonas sp. TaxID=114707 RepID=UPI0025D6B8A7|nr:ATP-binding protein [uncultured Pseudomonas sp.]